MLDAALS